MTRKLVAVTMGDPAGIGPEVIVKALASPRLAALDVLPVVVGDVRVIRAAARDGWSPPPRARRPRSRGGDRRGRSVRP